MNQYKPLEELVSRSQALGSNQNFVVFGGGNTSSKGEITDHLGRLKAILWVKGSGADMAYAVANGRTFIVPAGGAAAS